MFKPLRWEIIRCSGFEASTLGRMWRASGASWPPQASKSFRGIPAKGLNLSSLPGRIQESGATKQTQLYYDPYSKDPPKGPLACTFRMASVAPKAICISRLPSVTSHGTILYDKVLSCVV